jgi:DhnA family fructose-bisphosphate aldolase class Ia
LQIPAVGYTVYLGSKFEAAMLREAAQIVWQAHQAGLVAILWIYPRGRAVTNKYDPHLIAGAVNVGTALGADFIKVNRPNAGSAEALTEVISSAGKTRVLFAGGAAVDSSELLASIYLQVHRFGAAGAALGRNIHQHPLKEAIALANAVAAVVYEGQSPEAVRRFLVKN